MQTANHNFIQALSNKKDNFTKTSISHERCFDFDCLCEKEIRRNQNDFSKKFDPGMLKNEHFAGEVLQFCLDCKLAQKLATRDPKKSAWFKMHTYGEVKTEATWLCKGGKQGGCEQWLHTPEDPRGVGGLPLLVLWVPSCFPRTPILGHLPRLLLWLRVSWKNQIKKAKEKGRGRSKRSI